MKKLMVSVVALTAFAFNSFSQDTTPSTNYIRPKALAVSFVLNDFQTAQRIRSSSLGTVFNNDQWAKMKEMSPGIAVTYFKGLKDHVDFAATMAGSFTRISIDDETPTSEKFLLETDASLNLKMFSDKYLFTPYINVGVGASVYDGKAGAFIPLGGGLKLNLFDEAAIFINSQYRIPVTTTTAAYHFYNSIGIAGRIGK
jgi:OmpA-OmpF porin, OOP family